MEIDKVMIEFWISSEKRKFNCCDDAEKLLEKIRKLIESEGYDIPERMCSKNPRLYIST